MNKKILYTIITCILTVSLSVCGVIASGESEDIADVSQIDSFRGYAWGTSYEEIKSSEVTSDMKESLDYYEENVNDMIGLTIKNGSVAGTDTDVGYLFDDSGLIGGAYNPDIDEDSFEQWEQKYTDKYGKPVLSKESIGCGKCALWADDLNNFIFLSRLTGISYGKADGQYLKLLNDGLYEYFEIDLEEELNKLGNTDGI